jgi:uncharacterized protein (DUF433 family)
MIAGYKYRTGPMRLEKRQAPLFSADASDGDGILNLSFLDLIELRFVRDFLDEGVTLHVIRRAARAAEELFDSAHPFAVKRFVTDGKSIFAQASKDEGDDRMIDLLKKQHVFSHIVTRFIRQLKYGADQGVEQWYPMGPERPILVDPRRSFGAPIILSGVPTSTIARIHAAGSTVQKIADWYGVPEPQVRAAVKFERQLLAA